MSDLLVKICGITRIDDAEAAVALGARALGFVFWPGSPRFIDPYRARQIAASLPAFVTPVGLFVNQPADYINAVSALVGLGAVQLHGDETPGFVDIVKRPVIRAITQQADADVVWPSRVILLVDAHDPVRRGGTGSKADWGLAARLAATHRVLLAGGLSPENVVDAVRTVRPFGIDVSSGVELAPGVKDHPRLVALFDALRSSAVDTGSTT